MIHVPTKKSLKEKNILEKKEYPFRKKYFEKKCTHSSLGDMASYVDSGLLRLKKIPWYDGLILLSDEELERCKNCVTTKNSTMIMLKKIFVLLLFVTFVAVTFTILQRYYPFSPIGTKLGVWIIMFVVTGIGILALLFWMFSSNKALTLKFIEEIKQYRDDNLKAFKELIEEFIAQGKLSRKDAIDKMITSIYYSESGTDQPQNYFTWKDIGSKKFVKLFLTATE